MKKDKKTNEKFKLPSGTIAIKEEKISNKRTDSSFINIKYFLSVMTVLLLGIMLCMLLFFQIDVIKIEGTDIYSEQDVIELLNIEKGDNLFLGSIKASNEDLTRLMPYISDFKIKQKWPDTLIVSVEEAQAVCVAKTDVGYAVLSEDAKVLEHLSVMPDNMTLLNGLDILDVAPGHIVLTDNEDDLYILRDILSTLKASELNKIDTVDMTDTINIYIYYDNRLRIEIGTVNNIENKIKRVSEVIDRLDSTDTGRLDATIDGRVAYIPLKIGEQLYKQPQENFIKSDDNNSSAASQQGSEADPASEDK